MGKVLRAVLTTAASQTRKGPWQPNRDDSEGEIPTISTFATGGVYPHAAPSTQAGKPAAWASPPTWKNRQTHREFIPPR